MPGGQHISGSDHILVSCTGPVWLTGGAAVHAGIGDNSKMNLGCPYALTTPLVFTYFISASIHAIVNAQLMAVSGSGATGVRCNQYKADVFKPRPPQQFPGDQDGNC
jgi:hypothetical protein